MALLLSYGTWGMPTVPIDVAVEHWRRLGYDGLSIAVSPVGRPMPPRSTRPSASASWTCLTGTTWSWPASPGRPRCSRPIPSRRAHNMAPSTVTSILTAELPTAWPSPSARHDGRRTVWVDGTR